MSWSISELDKNKTEQSISNELARLDICKETLEKLKKEYEHEKYMSMVKLSDMEDKILVLERSIDSGAKFVEDCLKHLKTFE